MKISAENNALQQKGQNEYGGNASSKMHAFFKILC